MHVLYGINRWTERVIEEGSTYLRGPTSTLEIGKYDKLIFLVMLWGYSMSIRESCWRRTYPPRYIPRWNETVYQTQQRLCVKPRRTNQLKSHKSSSWLTNQWQGDKFNWSAEAFLPNVPNFIQQLQAGIWLKDWISWRWDYASLHAGPKETKIGRTSDSGAPPRWLTPNYIAAWSP